MDIDRGPHVQRKKANPEEEEYIMTGLERLKACVALQPVDRPGLLPSYTDRLAALQAGMTYADIIERPDDASAAMRNLWNRLGGYGDTVYYAGGTDIYYLAVKHFTRIKIPGRELPRDTYWQIVEKPNFTRDEYDILIDEGWNAFMLKMIPRVWDIPPEDLNRYGSVAAYHKFQGERSVAQYKKDTESWKKMGVDVFVGASVPTPQMALSCARSLMEYTIDLYEIPDKVEKALWAALPTLIENGIAGCRATGIPCVAIIIERGSAQLYPLNLFEKFEWPMMKRMVEEFVKNGITPLLHLDTDWTKNLPYFREFPKGRVVASFDGTTDLLNAKKVLRDHVCIMGDVPASLLVAGTTGEVEAYVTRLCDEVGEGGGFILGTGCSMPPNAKIENVQKMIAVCKSYAA
jgi:hypothetical protein